MLGLVLVLASYSTSSASDEFFLSVVAAKTKSGEGDGGEGGVDDEGCWNRLLLYPMAAVCNFSVPYRVQRGVALLSSWSISPSFWVFESTLPLCVHMSTLCEICPYALLIFVLVASYVREYCWFWWWFWHSSSCLAGGEHGLFAACHPAPGRPVFPPGSRLLITTVRGDIRCGDRCKNINRCRVSPLHSSSVIAAECFFLRAL